MAAKLATKAEAAFLLAAGWECHGAHWFPFNPKAGEACGWARTARAAVREAKAAAREAKILAAVKFEATKVPRAAPERCRCALCAKGA